MPTSSVWQGSPVFAVVSAVPGVSNPGQLADVAADSGADGGPNAQVIFYKAVYTTGSRGGTVATYPVGVTMTATVKRSTKPVMITPSSEIEPRAMSQAVLEVSTDEDPGVLLGARLETNDRCTWAGLPMMVIGTALPDGTGYVTQCLLVA